MTKGKKNLLRVLGVVYIALIAAFLVQSVRATREGGIAYPLEEGLLQKKPALAVPLKLTWLSGKPISAELVDALTAADVKMIIADDDPKTVVGQSLVGKTFTTAALPVGTRIEEEVLWAHVIGPEVEARKAAGEQETTVYLTGPGAMMGFDATLGLIVVNFLGLLVLLYLFLWEPILKVLDDRAATISGDLTNAAAKHEEATTLKRKYDQMLLGSKRQRQELIAEGRKEGDVERRRIVEVARQEADKIVARTREELQAAADKARSDLRTEIGGLSVQLAEKILSREVRAQDNQQLVQDFLAKLDQVDVDN